jgi:tight adherence protein B
VSPVVPSLFAAGVALTLTAGVRSLMMAGTARPSAIRLVARTGAGRRLGGALVRAGVRIGPDAYCALVVATAAVVALATFALFRSGVIPLVGALGVVVGATGFVRSADRRYLARLAGQLPFVAQQLAGGVGAGLSLRQAVARLAHDAPEPAADEFARLSRELDLGAPLDDALEAMGERLPSTGLRTMLTAIQVQRIAGGNLGTALTDLAGRLEDTAAQARMSAWLVAALPIVGAVLVELVSPGTLAATLGRGVGLVILVVATALQVVGVLLIRRLIRESGS